MLNALRTGLHRSQRQLAESAGLSLGCVNKALRQLSTAACVDGLAITASGLAALQPYRVTNAIIMAAGTSSRFAPVSYERPKGLLSVRGEVLIERQIRQLHEAGITDVTVVVGYRQEQLHYLEDAFSVGIAVNPDYGLRNNNSSIRVVEDCLDNTYICSSDNYFTSNVFEPYVYRSYYSAVWHNGPTDEWALTVAPSGRITRTAPGGADCWVMLGHVYWDRSFSAAFREVLDAVYDEPQTVSKLWEEIYAEHIDHLPLYLRKYDAETIYEFDTIDDLRNFDPDFILNVDSAILDNICATLGCTRSDLDGFTPIIQGLTNMSFSFKAKDQYFVYRHPGASTMGILDRCAEAQVEQIAYKHGLDNTFVHIDADEGWKISRYISTSEPFDYHNHRHVEMAMMAVRRLHDCGETIESKFDLMTHANVLAQRLAGGSGAIGQTRLDFPDFDLMTRQALHLAELCRADGYQTVICHNDLYAANMLIDGNDISLIDWEYAGMGDPAGDIGGFVCCCFDYSWDESVDVIATYLGHQPTTAELRHYVAYVAIAAYHWWVWSLYKDVIGEGVGQWVYVMYRYAMEYGRKAMAMYEQGTLDERPHV